MTTKYIVNNASGQTISEINSTTIISDTISATTYSNLPIPSYISSGPFAPGSAVVANNTDVDINFSDGVGTAWSFSTTGMTFPDDTVQTTAYEPKYKVYTALLTQSGDSNLIIYTAGTLEIGKTYEIYDYTGAANFDFTNVGAPNNNIGTYFVATGTIPNSWGTNVGLKANTGAPVVTVLENTIGNVYWSYIIAGGYRGTIDEDLVTEGKQAVFSPPVAISTSGNKYFVAIENSSVNGIVGIYSTDGTDYINDGLVDFPIEIRVYN
jgi:hypothetical protein